MSVCISDLQKVPDSGTAPARAPGNGEPAGIRGGPDLRQVPVEEVSVQLASRLVFHTDPQSPAADRLRFLRMRLREVSHEGKLKRLLITSPLPHDGKSTVAANLATALAERGNRAVLLIEGDLHHAYLSQQFGLQARPGLAGCLDGSVNPMSAIRRLEPLRWYFLPAGPPRANAAELLQSESLAGVIQALSPHFDWVLIDSPPVVPLTDALALRRQADASLLVVRAGRTPRAAVDDAIALLGRDHVLGIILNGVEGLERLYSKYYGHYGYPAADAPKTGGRATAAADEARRSARP